MGLGTGGFRVQGLFRVRSFLGFRVLGFLGFFRV